MVDSSKQPVADSTNLLVKSTNQLVEVQYLRGIAALMVAYFHLTPQIPAFAAALSFGGRADWLSHGVDVFFVISGFIMVVTSRKLSAGTFLWRRFGRIVPLYWLLTLLLAALVILVPAQFRTTVLSPSYLIKSLLFIPYQNPGQGDKVLPMLVPGWSLNIEMYFYLVFAATLFTPIRRFQFPFCCLVLGAVAVIANRHGPLAQFYANPSIGWFCVGMALGELHLRFAPVWRTYKIPLLGLLGDASYSIYLTHIFTLGVMRVLWPHLRMGAAPFAIASMIAVCAVALASYHWLEVPITAYLRRITLQQVIKSAARKFKPPFLTCLRYARRVSW